MTYILPIDPEPASRIYSGEKKFELRKQKFAKSGFVYLYEMANESVAIRTITGGFYFNNVVTLPIDQLWELYGEFSTTRTKFEKYFRGYKKGVAMFIQKVEKLATSISVVDLKKIDAEFDTSSISRGFLKLPTNSEIKKYLDLIPRSSHFHNGDLDINPKLKISLMRKEDTHIFKDLYNKYVKPNYPDSEDYAEFVLGSYASKEDPFGYFTQRKKIWALWDEMINFPIGFTVVTEKRGGSIKFGPTILAYEKRGLGMGVTFRLMVEQKYPNARKAYNTLPDDNQAALSYVLKAGYSIEAHLSNQYRKDRGEIVVGKLLNSPQEKNTTPHKKNKISGELKIVNGCEISKQKLFALTKNLLSDGYSDINMGFVNGLIRASSEGDFDLSKKTKRFFVATRNKIPCGLIIVTPKRGGAIKCSPISLIGEDSDAALKLLDFSFSAFSSKEPRKFYTHIPYFDTWLIDILKSLDFIVEGILKSPYKSGVDMIILGKNVEGRASK